jgi:glycerol kinase
MTSLLAIDQGTTSSRAILFSDTGDILDVSQKELKLHYPHKGWVEQDPKDILNDTLDACRAVLKNRKDVAGLGITNQRETTIIWDRKTGEPAYNAIVWQDRRTAEHCEDLKQQGHEELITAKTGLLLDPYFSATKVAWILKNVEGAQGRADRGELAFGTVDCFLLWHLTGGIDGGVHATDITNASRTMLFNIVEQCWDEALLELFDIPASLLPNVQENVTNFGSTAPDLLPMTLPIGGMAGDQQAAMIGQACFESGMVKSTYGTGCFALMNIGEQCKLSQNKLLTTVGYKINGQTSYALEGSIFIAGAAIQWLRDGLNIFDDSAQSETLAISVDDNNGVYFVPAFTGLGAPYWRPEARGLITGLGRESTKAHIARAALEAQAFQTRDLMGAMQKDAEQKIGTIRVDGGLVANKFMCQFLSDMNKQSVQVPKITEATAWGAACLAGLQVGVFESIDEIADIWQARLVYTPKMSEDERAHLYGEWQSAVEMLLQL